MKLYRGERTMDGAKVTVDGRPLAPRLDLKRYSDRGFEWSYEGAEPTQLALALLADHLGDDTRAVRLCGAFMRRVVANFANDWEMSSGDLEAALKNMGSEGT
jgi:hypothetical protein